MYAVVRIHSPSNLDPVKFFSGVPKKGSLEQCIERSSFQTTPEVGSDAVYWDAGTTGVTIVFRDGTNAYQAHVENARDSTCMPHLKRLAEGALCLMVDAAKCHAVKIDSQQIELYTEDSLIQVGSKGDIWSYVRKQFVEKLLSQFITAATVAGVAWLTSRKEDTTRTAAATFVAVFVALFGRVIIEAFLFQKRVNYVDA